MNPTDLKVRLKNDIRRQRRNVLPLEINSDAESIYHNSDECDTVFELPTRKEESYVEKELQTNDTLQSIALDFNCSIAELKRINKIHKENEIFALRVIKIPIIPGSFIIEKLQSSSKHSNQDKLSINDSAVLQPLQDSSNSTKENVVSHEIQKFDVLATYNNQPENLSNHINFHLEEPRVSPEQQSLLWRCNGDDCGISWKPLLIFIASLGLVGPLIYLYFSTKL